ncbi:putative frost protein [Coniochaeta sp. PMI_546]|nr:putative frost protein [Coniochaeta sp. PMI_546]
MARYSNDYGTAHNAHSNAFSSAFHHSSRRDIDSSLLDDCLAGLKVATRSLWGFWKGSGRYMVLGFLVNMLRQLRYNLAMRRLLSFPHALVVVWVLLLLWGERWVFHSRVESCHWSSWENWPPGATPHRLVLVADPQLIDPHSYPGRPWPLNPITVTITDNYLRRSYNQLQQQLRPDTVFFLGDLFDGGREWKTAHGEFKDPEWGQHPAGEQKYVKKWNKKYGEDYWLKEYARFGDIFLGPWIEAGDEPGPGQRGRKLIASLPGNHDLGFGSEIKIPVRNRFEAYFGDVNRVDVIGNHTFVSVDTVSLSARTSDEVRQHDLKDIYMPAELFLNSVQKTKRRAVGRELRYQRGDVEEVQQSHTIQELGKADFKNQPTLDPGEGKGDLPSILLTHVPLYRPPGTPCGPLREHWPPTKPPKGQKEPVNPDHRNAISVTRGYQYQNVLSEDDSVRILESVGHVVHAFSGDDHDYCELKHDARQGHVPEITVKSISMAMGVPTPGFLMVSLYNPIDEQGKSLLGEAPTLQTHLCLLPRMGQVYSRYIGFGLFCLVVLAARAFLVPVLKLERFAFDPAGEGSNGLVLPMFKAKVEDYDEYAAAGVAGFSASRFLHGGTRGRSGSTAESYKTKGSRHGHAKDKDRDFHRPGQGKWGWGGASQRGPPKIEIRSDEDDFYDGGKWKAASARSRSSVQVVVREFLATAWRVAWMAVLLWVYLEYKG